MGRPRTCSLLWGQATHSSSIIQLSKAWFLNLHVILICMCALVGNTVHQLRCRQCKKGHGDRCSWSRPSPWGKRHQSAPSPLTSPGLGLGFPHWRHIFYLHCVYLEWHGSPEVTSRLPLPSTIAGPSGFNQYLSTRVVYKGHLQCGLPQSPLPLSNDSEPTALSIY